MHSTSAEGITDDRIHLLFTQIEPVNDAILTAGRGLLDHAGCVVGVDVPNHRVDDAQTDEDCSANACNRPQGLSSAIAEPKPIVESDHQKQVGQHASDQQTDRIEANNDADTQIVRASSAGAYWAADFPAATYAVPLSAGSDLLGVFNVDATAVTLLGVVSPTAGSFGTNISYDPPAIILKLPITPNAQWSSSSTVSGTLNGGFVNYTETYESVVDSVGTLKTPYGEFPVMRVATDMEQLQVVTPFGGKRSFAWVAECFGSVANVTSQDFESSSEFNDPAEVRRLAP